MCLYIDLSEIQTQIEKLSLDEQKQIIKELFRLVNNMDIDIAKMQIAQKATESRHCPHCNSSKIIKNGKEHSVQRFSCRDCKRSYRVKQGHSMPECEKGRGNY